MSEIEFTPSDDVAYGVAEQVSPLIRRVMCNNPGPFTYKGTASYIVGSGQVAIIDPGPDDAKHLAALLTAIDGETVSHIVITHTHLDHSPLAARLKRMTGAPTIGYGPHGGRVENSGDMVLDASGDMDFVPDQTIDHGEVINGKGWSLEAVFTPGHCANHMAYGLEQEKALFSGDHVMAWSTSVIAPPDGNMADYFASLDKLLTRDDEVYWPGHGPEKRNPLPFVAGFAKHRRAREAAILRLVQAGESDIMAIVRQLYAGVDPKLHRAAALSVLAHMEHLMVQGKVVVEEGTGVSGVYGTVI